MHSKVARDDTVILIEFFYTFLSFEYKTSTMLEVDQRNKLTCAHINDLGFNDDSFLIKAQHRYANLVQRLLEQTIEEEPIIALAQPGISLSSDLCFVGPKCLSTDEIFKVIQ
jgi:hypothetical protein